MSKRYVLLQYDEETRQTAAFKLGDDGELRRLPLPAEGYGLSLRQVVRGPAGLGSSVWPQSYRVLAEGVEYLRLVAIRASLQILDEGEVSQARVQDEIDKLTDPRVLTDLAFERSDTPLPDYEDPEACDRDCVLEAHHVPHSHGTSVL